MNLPRNGCCWCSSCSRSNSNASDKHGDGVDCCSGGGGAPTITKMTGSTTTMLHSPDLCLNSHSQGEQGKKQIFVLHPTKLRGRLRSSTSPPTCLRHRLNNVNVVSLLCILSLVFLSFANLANSASDISSFNSNSFQNGESTPAPFGGVSSNSNNNNLNSNNNNLPSIPSASSSSLNNVVVPGPSLPTTVQQQQQAGMITSPPQPSVTQTQSYFINGYANQIQKTNVTDLRALAGNKPFQLQFRTVCPFGNIMNDVSQ